MAVKMEYRADNIIDVTTDDGNTFVFVRFATKTVEPPIYSCSRCACLVIHVNLIVHSQWHEEAQH